MSSTVKIFITGATGYIGGVVLQRLLAHAEHASFEITALVRDDAKAKKLNDLGVKTQTGSFARGDLLEELAAASDVVIHTVRIPDFTSCPILRPARFYAEWLTAYQANADDLDAARAILRGLNARHAKTGQVPIYIHTSGTGVLIDNAKGEYASETIYHDSDVAQIESLAPSQPHREVDVEVVAADQAGYVRTYIILPSTIWGIGAGPVYDAGIANPYSQQIPGAIRASVRRGQGGVVGAGKNVWPHIWIQDQGDIYKIIFDAARADPHTPHGREGFYFGEAGEYTLYDAARTYTQALHALGKSATAEPTSFTDEEIQQYFGGPYLGSNSRARGDRARALGWKPTKTTDDFYASIGPEVDAAVGIAK
ncbi:NAD-P-binding protein [Auriscalpium vulgare]|uniref:NAD-P-binding protein n=1 Tax=Auriscalpium vulgare TaxID=40419 RepID=A0ACB8RHN3_9AGAM|nr:NAD-P-binding protein [Auriscalpium vulgare]